MTDTEVVGWGTEEQKGREKGKGGKGKGEGKEGGKGYDKGTPKWNIETVVFVPYTPNSELRNTLQKKDNEYAAMFSCPRVRFVEREGITITEELTASDPWAKETFCP